MKKLLLSFALLVAGVMTVGAQTFVVPETGKFYKIKGDNETLHWLTGTLKDGSIVVSANEAEAATFKKTENGLQEVQTGKYIGMNNDKVSLVDNEGTITLEAKDNTEGKYAIRVGETYMYNNNTDGITHESSNWITNIPRFWGFIEEEAPVLEYVVSGQTGTFNKGGYAAVWTFTNTAAREVTLSLNVTSGNNNMMPSTNAEMWLYPGNGGCTYRLKVALPYAIKGYSFDYKHDANQNHTITIGNETLTVSDQVQSKEVTGLEVQEADFKLGGNNTRVTFSNFKVLIQKLPTTTFTYRYLLNGNEIASEQVEAVIGHPFPAPGKLAYGTAKVTLPDGNVEASCAGETYDIDCSNVAPFEYADRYENITQWYYIQMKSNDKKWIEYVANGNYIEWADKDLPTTGSTKAHAWAFVGDPVNGFKLYNRAAGASVSVKSTGSGNPGMAADGTAFILAASKVTTEGYFCLQHPTQKNYLNAQSGKVNHWNSNDEGSTFTVAAYSELAMAKDDARDHVAEHADRLGEGIGYASYTIEDVKTIAADAVNTAINNATSAEAVNAIVNSFKYEIPEAGLSYFFYDDINEVYLNITNSKTNASISTEAKNLYVTGDETNGTWKIHTTPTGGEFLHQERWNTYVSDQDSEFSWITELEVVEGNVYYVLKHTNGDNKEYQGYLGANSRNNGKELYVNAPVGEAFKFRLVVDLDRYKESFKPSVMAQTTLLQNQPGYYYCTINDAKVYSTEEALAIIDAAQTREEVDAIVEATKNQQLVLPEAGQYYLIISALPGFATDRAIYSDGAPKWKILDAGDTAFYWTITPNQDASSYTFQNVKDRKYLNGTSMQDTEPTDITILEFLALGQFNITAGGKDLHANSHNSGDGTSGTIIKYDGNANSASAWRIVRLEHGDIAKAMLQYHIDEYTHYFSGNVGCYKPVLDDELAAAEAVLNGEQSTSDDYTTALTTLKTAATAASTTENLVLPETNKFYRIRHPNAALNAYILSDQFNSTKLKMGYDEFTSIFYYGEEENLLSYAIGRYLPKAERNGDWRCLAVGTEGPAATFGKGSKTGHLGFYIGDDETRAYYSANRTYVNAGGKFGNEGYDWVIEEVTSLPVALTQVGDKAWATLYAPVALTVPENVTAYYGVINNDEYLTLVEIESGVIPANEGVILCADAAGTYYFAVEGEADDIKTNRLAGNVAAKVNGQKTAEQIPYYTLQSNGSSVVFKQYNADFNGFRAYLELTDAQAKSISIRFGEDEGTTDIENVEIRNEKSEMIFDLLGRRVETMTKGGIYIVNGKKVVVK